VSSVRQAISLSTLLVVAVAGLAVVGLLVSERERGPAAWRTTTAPVVMAAGDIACRQEDHSFHGGAGTPTACRARATSDLAVQASPTALLALGDVQYGLGSLTEYAASFDPTWGRLRAITHPVPGDEDYGHSDGGAEAYFAYFGLASGAPGNGYYSFDLDSWHLVALNTNIPLGPGSMQERWLRADLAANRSPCTLAFMHRPRFSSGGNGDGPSITPLWRVLYHYHADVVLTGHDHDYERFKPQTPDGKASDRGIREFVVGTGGTSHGGTGARAANSEVFDNTTFGLLRLDLGDGSYDWRFVPEPGSHFTDAGHETCNPKPPGRP
jgi:calcineurin-like phosphoesterase family protein